MLLVGVLNPEKPVLQFFWAGLRKNSRDIERPARESMWSDCEIKFGIGLAFLVFISCQTQLSVVRQTVFLRWITSCVVLSKLLITMVRHYAFFRVKSLVNFVRSRCQHF